MEDSDQKKSSGEEQAKPEAPVHSGEGPVEASDGAATAKEIEEPVPEVVQLDPMARLRQQNDDLAAKLRTVSKAYTDLQEEMDGFRQRQMQLAEVKAQKKAGDVVVAFFEPVQNLKRCLETAGEDVTSVKQGIEMVLGQFSTQMDQLGLKEIPGIGSRFDPNVHNALAMTPVQEKEKDGMVLMVHAAGYAVGSRVIQPAQVIIGKFEETKAEA